MPDPSAGRGPASCGTCRHWDQGKARGGWDMQIRLTRLPGEDEDEDDYSVDSSYHQRVQAVEARYGCCGAVTLLDSYEATVEADVPIAFTRDGSDYRASLFTRDDFGCVLWTAP